MNISFLQAIGCFTVRGKINSHVHSHHTSSEYDPENNTLRIKGALLSPHFSLSIPIPSSTPLSPHAGPTQPSPPLHPHSHLTRSTSTQSLLSAYLTHSKRSRHGPDVTHSHSFLVSLLFLAVLIPTLLIFMIFSTCVDLPLKQVHVSHKCKILPEFGTFTVSKHDVTFILQ